MLINSSNVATILPAHYPMPHRWTFSPQTPPSRDCPFGILDVSSSTNKCLVGARPYPLRLSNLMLTTNYSYFRSATRLVPYRPVQPRFLTAQTRLLGSVYKGVALYIRTTYPIVLTLQSRSCGKLWCCSTQPMEFRGQ